MTIDDMIQIKTEKSYSITQMSQYTQIPIGTLQKIFSKETKSPRYASRQALEQFFAGNNPDRVDYNALQYDTQNNMSENADFVRESAAAYSVGKRQGEYTLDDYYALPDDRRVELIDGVIYDMASPTSIHQAISGEIYFQVKSQIRKRGGGCIPYHAPLDIQLDCDNKTILQPDFLILCDRKKLQKWGILGAPEFVAEILSPSTKKKDIFLKLEKYMNAGVKEYWIIDPDKRSVRIHDFQHEMVELHPFAGEIGICMYDKEIVVNMDEVAEAIRDYPE